jgi:hypothetical protein
MMDVYFDPLSVQVGSIGQLDTVTSLNLADPDLFHHQAGKALVSFHDCPWFPTQLEPKAAAFQVDATPDLQCVIFDESSTSDHVISQLQAGADLLVYSGSTIRTAGSSSILTVYAPLPHPASRFALPLVRWFVQRAKVVCLLRSMMYLAFYQSSVSTHSSSSAEFSPLPRLVTRSIMTRINSPATVARAHIWYASPRLQSQVLGICFLFLSQDSRDLTSRQEYSFAVSKGR